jgi:hypothetical protein
MEDSVMAKDKDEARAQGFKRGLQGKAGNASLLQGWTDDKAAGTARTQGYTEGTRRRSQLEAEKRARSK